MPESEEENSDEKRFDAFLGGLGWFAIGFIGLMIIFIFLRPPFFIDLIEPFWDWFGLHYSFNHIISLLIFSFEEFGIFLVFLVVVFFWWVFFTRKNNETKKGTKPEK